MKSTIYILPGWAYQTDKWQPLLAHLQASGFDPRLLNIPGLTAPLDEVWTLDDYVIWLGKSLSQAKKPVVLLGHSNGGRIALAYSLRYKNRVKQLILIDSAGLKLNNFKLKLKRFIFNVLAKSGRRLTTADLFRQILYKLARESDYRQASPLMQQTMQNLISIDLKDSLHRIHTPTVIIWGQADNITPLIQGQTMRELLPKSKLYTIKDARHSPQFTHPQQVVDIISSEIS